METALVQKKQNVSVGFKSYYVVWKRLKPCSLVGERLCLNRTM